MRIWLHLTLMILAEFSGFFLGALAVWVLIPAELHTAASPLDFALVAVGALAGAFGARWFFRRVAALCPSCGGRSFHRGIRPIAYHCAECGHVHETRVRSNW
jgi:hypothetical protein